MEGIELQRNVGLERSELPIIFVTAPTMMIEVN
jgi:hypothetical protein